MVEDVQWVVWFTWMIEEARHLGVGKPCCTGSKAVMEKPGRPSEFGTTATELGFPGVGQLSQDQIYHVENK